MTEPPDRGERRGGASLRLRLAGLSVTIVALAQIVVFSAVILYQRQYVQGRFDDRLRDGLETVAPEISPARLAIAKRLDVPVDIVFDDLLYRDLSLAVFSADGGLLASDVTIPDDLASLVRPRLAGLGDGVEFTHGRVARGRPGHSPRSRIALRRLVPGDNVLVVFASTDHIERTTRTTVAAFLIALPITLIVVACASWYVAGLVMRPIEEVRDIARRLAPDSIPEEVDLDSPAPEVQRLEADLTAAMTRIEAGYESQSRFMTNVAHELKTPISVILAQGQTLSQRVFENEETREFIDSTVEETRRLGRMIESFLILTRVREGKAAHHRTAVLVNETIMDSIERCLPMAREYGVRLVPSLIDADAEAVVLGDGDLLRTAIDNLVRNAIRFGPKGELIEITARDAGEVWTVDVRDRGPGIPPELIDDVFDRFAQARDEVRRARGSGLGLEIAQGIVELHGGVITVSNETPGCRFVVRLPKPDSA